jgi:hypothetical protein
MGDMGEENITDAEFAELLGDVADDLSELAVDGHGRLVNITDWREARAPKPPPVDLVHISDVGSVLGKRLVYASQNGRVRYNLRAASEVYEDTEGRWVRLALEHDYFRWINTPESERSRWCPNCKAMSLVNLWVDPTS